MFPQVNELGYGVPASRPKKISPEKKTARFEDNKSSHRSEGSFGKQARGQKDFESPNPDPELDNSFEKMERQAYESAQRTKILNKVNSIKREKNAYDAYDDKPIVAKKNIPTSNWDEDERPIKPAANPYNAYDEKPVGGKGNQDFNWEEGEVPPDDKTNRPVPLGKKSKAKKQDDYINPYDERPLTGATSSNPYDERPIGPSPSKKGQAPPQEFPDSEEYANPGPKKPAGEKKFLQRKAKYDPKKALEDAKKKERLAEILCTHF